MAQECEMTREETRLRGAREPSIHLERELVWGAVIYRIQSKSFEKKKSCSHIQKRNKVEEMMF